MMYLRSRAWPIGVCSLLVFTRFGLLASIVLMAMLAALSYRSKNIVAGLAWIYVGVFSAVIVMTTLAWLAGIRLTSNELLCLLLLPIWFLFWRYRTDSLHLGLNKQSIYCLAAALMIGVF